ncbi:hypothetical protein ACHAWU_006666 [Discostella pseudostelligera]|uniref:Dolichol-phosphate mannosyltransferase subunit 3 n=1 Tax=Discostella pseudostelligera TaxID=259834 RepID=A0ABD3M0B9_9STRA
MVELLSYQIFLSIGIIFLQVWYTCLLNLEKITAWWSSRLNNIISISGGGVISVSGGSGSSTHIIEIIIRYLPVWTILSLGIYALSMVLVRVHTMKDCPEAAVELAKEIEMAKESLRRKGLVI